MREAGLIACLVGVVVMAIGRFGAHMPVMTYVGLATIVLGWGLLALSAWNRRRISPPPSSRTERNGV